MPRFGNIGTEAKAELEQHKTATPAHSVSQITDAVDKKGSTMTGALYLSGNPTQDMQAASKAYVDATRQGLAVKYPCRVATTANILLNGLQTVDGMALAVGDRVLVKDQTNALQNGIYTAQTGDWIRADDADNTPGAEVMSGMFTFISAGTVNKSAGFTLATPDPVNLGTTPLYFIQFSGAGEITTTSDLTKNGNQLGLSTTGVAAGTYRSVIVDAKGRVTGGTNPTTLVGYGITASDALLNGFGGYAKDISNSDLNNLAVTGFYRGANLTNNPSGSVSWFYVKVIAHSADYVFQEVAEYYGSSDGAGQNKRKYYRTKTVGTWSNWKQLVTTDNPVFTGSTILGATSSAVSDANIGNSQINLWLNESANALTFRVKYSNGTLKTGTIALS